MCGIAGISWEDQPLAERMVGALRHRGPDDQCVLGLVGLTLGHARLSILDPSSRGRQPMRYEHQGRSYAVTFNGEIYNHADLRRELSGMGFVFRTTTDTEVLLAAYAAWREGMLARLVGMWAFALHDQARGTLFLARDRLGEKPLYYHETADAFVFASEIKAIRVARPSLRRHCAETVAAYLHTGLAGHSDRTFFEGVRRIPAAHYATWDLQARRLRLDRYYALTGARTPTGKGALRERLEQSVARCLVSDVPVCISLSGGVDSSSVAALVARSRTDAVEAFTTVPPRRAEGDERRSIRHFLARHPNVRCVETGFDVGSLVEDYRSIVYHMEEPFLWDSPYPRWVNARAVHAHGYKVVLTGEGADELLAGYRSAHPLFLSRLRAQGRWLPLVYEMASALLGAGGFKLLAAFARRSWGRMEGRAPHPSNRFIKLAPPAPASKYTGRDGLRAFLLASLTEFFLPYLLDCNDKMYMAHSVEARSPFLDRDFVECALAVPAEELVRNGYRKHPLRADMRGLVPAKVLWSRGKIGFGSPFSRFLTGLDMRSRFESLFAEPRSSGLVDVPAVRLLYRQAVEKGRAEPGLARVIALEEWMSRFQME
jgi:asparagine synthase (glutamine-hydrolysing)